MAGAPDVDPAIGRERKSRGADDAAIAELAERQHGFVARWQPLGFGIGTRAIDHRLARRRLHPLHRGVYAVGHRAISQRGRWMAAVLAGGPGGALGHRSAAAHWGIRDTYGGPIDVTLPRQRRSRGGVKFHVARLPADELTVHEGIPITTVTRTLFDLASILRPRQLERAINEAEVLRLWDELSLEDLLYRYPGRAGSPAVGAVLQRRRAGARITRSDLEVAFLEFVDEAGLPGPETNVLVEGYVVDAVWREQRLVVELDGEGFHSTSEAFERDRERDRVLQASGWRIVRITWKQLKLTRRRLEVDLRALLRMATLTE